MWVFKINAMMRQGSPDSHALALGPRLLLLLHLRLPCRRSCGNGRRQVILSVNQVIPVCSRVSIHIDPAFQRCASSQ